MSLADRIGRRVEAIEGATPDKLARAAQAILRATVRAFSEPGSPDHHSRPGETPLKQSGRLAAGFRAEVRGDTVVLSNDAPHARYVFATRDKLEGVRSSKDEVRKIISDK